MLDAAIVLGRLVQYVAAMIVFGAPLVILRGAPPSVSSAPPLPTGWAKPALGVAAAVLAVAAALGLFAQTAMFAGSASAALTPDALRAVFGSMAIGPSTLIRELAALVTLAAVAALPEGRRLWMGCVALGGVACVSFAWMGHGAATEGSFGWIHLVADLLHLLAAAAWTGALVAFVSVFIAVGTHSNRLRALEASLRGFAGLGSLLVLTLLLTGLVNGAFTVSPTHLSGLWTTRYGQLLLVKLLLFIGMLSFASFNRFRLTPDLGEALDHAPMPEFGSALTSLRLSVIFETGLAFAVIGLVSWLGTLAPPATS